jgi:PAS domain S-box-containing protein
VSEVGQKIGVSRNSAAKYLDVMLSTGELEQKMVGRARIFYISQKVPTTLLLDHTSDLIITVNHNNTITQVNKKFLDFFNIQKLNVIEKQLQNVLDPNISHKLFKLFENNIQSKLVQIGDNFFRSKVLETVLLDGTSGKTLFLENVTDEEKYSIALEESDKIFHTFVRAATSGLVLTDKDLNVIEINDAALNFTGLEREQVLGKHILDFLPDTETSGRYESYLKVIKEKGTQSINEVIFPPSLGGKKVIVSVFSAGEGLGMIVTDISHLG